MAGPTRTMLERRRPPFRSPLLALLAALALAPAARAADVYTIAGDGDGPLTAGALAGRADIVSLETDVAADPRGGFAMTMDGRVWHVGSDGRLRPLGIGRRASHIAYAADGTLFAGAGSAIWRVSPDGLASVAVAGLAQPWPLAPDRDGGVLVADGERLLRLAPDGTLSLLATGYGEISDAAVSADGRLVAATETSLQELAPRIRGLGPAPKAVAALADGTLVEAHGEVWGAEPWAWRIEGANVHRPPFARRNLVGFDVWNGLNPLGRDDVYVDAFSATPDGGLLVAANGAIHYLAPAQPALLAVAVGAVHRIGARSVAVRLRLTAPAATTVRVWRERRLVARADLPPGTVAATLRARRRLEPALYRVTAEARSGPAAAATRAHALIAPALPAAVARGIVETQARWVAAYDDLPLEPGRCRRYGARRVDCAAEVRGSCAGVLSMVWRRDGHLTWTLYGRRSGPCVISRSRGVDVRSRRRRSQTATSVVASRRSRCEVAENPQPACGANPMARTAAATMLAP